MATPSDPRPLGQAPAVTQRRAGALSLLKNPRAVWRFLRDPAAPMLPRLLALFAVLYVVMPFDALPDVVPVLGWLDDLGITGAVIAYVASQAANHQAARQATPAA